MGRGSKSKLSTKGPYIIVREDAEYIGETCSNVSVARHICR
jgi:hypothetical protein